MYVYTHIYIYIFVYIHVGTPVYIDVGKHIDTYMLTGIYIHICTASRLGLQNTPTAPLQRGKTTPTSVLDMTLKI